MAPLFIASYGSIEFDQLHPINHAASTIEGCAAPHFLTHICTPPSYYLIPLIQREHNEEQGGSWSDELDLAQASQTAISLIFPHCAFPQPEPPTKHFSIIHAIHATTHSSLPHCRHLTQPSFVFPHLLSVPLPLAQRPNRPRSQL